VFYDSRERKREGGRTSGFCGRISAARNARGSPVDSLPVFIKGLRAPGKKRNIRATQSVSPVPYVVLRPLPLWLLISPFSPAFAFSSCPTEGTLPLTASLSFSRPLLSFSFSTQSLRSGRNLLRGSTRRRTRRIRLHIRRRRSEDLSRASASAPSWCRRIGAN